LVVACPDHRVSRAQPAGRVPATAGLVLPRRQTLSGLNDDLGRLRSGHACLLFMTRASILCVESEDGGPDDGWDGRDPVRRPRCMTDRTMARADGAGPHGAVEGMAPRAAAREDDARSHSRRG
jgi:hypothetical protein